jgi:hypothetical protein
MKSVEESVAGIPACEDSRSGRYICSVPTLKLRYEVGGPVKREQTKSGDDVSVAENDGIERNGVERVNLLVA